MGDEETPRSVLVGRDEELARLVATVGRPPAVAVIEGEAGIGKTRMVTELRARPELAGRRWLAAGCAHIREPFPLGPLVEALRGTGERLAEARLSAVAGALRPLLPELGEVLPEAPEPLDDPHGERHRVFRGLTEILAALGETVLVIEDAHWADEQTVDFLGYLLSAPPPGLSLVLTYRGAEVAAATRSAATRPAPAVTTAHVALTTLDVPQTRALATAILGADGMSEEFAVHLWERTAGLPFAVQELLALLRQRGSLIRRGGGWARRVIEALDVPTGVRDSVLERVGGLSAHARAVTEAAAVLQAPVPVPVLVAACRTTPDQALEGLEEVLEAGLFTEHGESVGLRHMLAVQAVYEAMSLPRRQALHVRAAAAVRGLTPVPLGRLAHHLGQAGQAAEWIVAALAAADQAERLGDDAEAARLLEDLLRRAPLEPERRAELSERVGWLATRTVRVPDVTDLITEALDLDPPRPLRGRLWFALAVNHDVLGATAEAKRAALVAAARDLEDEPWLSGWAMALLGMPLADTMDRAEMMGWLERALARVGEIDDPVKRVFVLGKAAMTLSVLGDRRWRELADRIVAETGGRPRARQEILAYCTLVEEACHLGDLEIAERLHAAAQEGAGDGDAHGETQLRCRYDHALIAHYRGDWDGLAAEAAELDEECVGRPHMRLDLEAMAASLALAQHGPDGARERLLAVVAAAARGSHLDLLPLTGAMLLRLGLAEGEPERALAETAEVVRMWDEKGLWPLGLQSLPALVAALAAAGRREEAAAYVARAEAELAGLDAPLAPAALPYARGHLAAASGQVTDAAAYFTVAAAAYDELGCRYAAAQARESLAEALDSAEALASALDAYERLGARWDADRVAARGAAKGFGPPPPEILSPREREVAELAAEGLTNREIAERLFIAVKTVDKHLSSALRKLGLRSRTELAVRVRAGGADWA